MDKMSIIIIFIVAVVAGILATIFDARNNTVMSANKAKRLTDKIRKENLDLSLSEAINMLSSEIKKEAHNQKFQACCNIAKPIQKNLFRPTEKENEAIMDNVERYFRNKGYHIHFVMGADYSVINCYAEWCNPINVCNNGRSD
jgi:hypothetical protein